MSDITNAWRAALDDVKKQVTGRTVWMALDAVQPVTMEEDIAVLGVPPESSTMLGHLRAVPTKRAIERVLSEKLGRDISVEIISGTSLADWEHERAREEHASRLQQKEYERARDVRRKEQLWESSYEGLSRLFAGYSNKSLPQNRARFLVRGLDLIAEAVKSHGELDEVAERNIARLIERVAGYADVPATMAAHMLLQKLGD